MPERLICLKYYIVLKWESSFTFVLNAAKITDYIKKLLKYKLFRIKIHKKKSVGTHEYLSQEWS